MRSLFGSRRSEEAGPLPEEDFSDARMKHLEFVQAAITRMASNSFVFKGWAISLASGLAAFAAIESTKPLLIIVLLSTGLFWAMDAYYLWLERGFVKRWVEIADAPASQPVDFNMRPVKDGGFCGWVAVFFRWHLLLFYGVIMLADVLAIIYFKEIKS